MKFKKTRCGRSKLCSKRIYTPENRANGINDEHLVISIGSLHHVQAIATVGFDAFPKIGSIGGSMDESFGGFHTRGDVMK